MMSQDHVAARPELAVARRIVIKIGSSSLTSVAGGLSADRIDALVDALAGKRADGAQVVLVSSGAIAAGLSPLGFKNRPREVASQQASASVGQMLLIARYAASFARYGVTVGQVLLTAEDVIRRAHYRNALRTFERLLELGAVPVVNENDTIATGEIQFGDNDRLAALVAHLVRADALVLLSDVDGLYTNDPKKAGASLIDTVRGPRDVQEVDTSGSSGSGLGTGGMASKIAAAELATDAGIHAVVTSAANAAAAMRGERVGTHFLPTSGRAPARELWLRHATNARGVLVLDDGATHAVRERGASLLAAGIIEVRGLFVAGDPVDLITTGGDAVGRGLVGFDSDELPALLGLRSDEIAVEQRREVVHRDDLVLVAGRAR
ncbi:MAG: glutamate 5-kinase [Corynebacteriales bacterium]|nr:glutamate 5-kinase [Mycobacteriales bacterium]